MRLLLTFLGLYSTLGYSQSLFQDTVSIDESTPITTSGKYSMKNIAEDKRTLKWNLRTSQDKGIPVPSKVIKAARNNSSYTYNIYMVNRGDLIENVNEEPVTIYKNPKAMTEADAKSLTRELGFEVTKGSYPYELDSVICKLTVTRKVTPELRRYYGVDVDRGFDKEYIFPQMLKLTNFRAYNAAYEEYKTSNFDGCGFNKTVQYIPTVVLDVSPYKASGEEDQALTNRELHQIQEVKCFKAHPTYGGYRSASSWDAANRGCSMNQHSNEVIRSGTTPMKIEDVNSVFDSVYRLQIYETSLPQIGSLN